MVAFSVVDVPKKLFVLFVGIAGIAPRMPFDEPCSIGGNLSSSFRRILLFVTSFNLLRIILIPMVADWVYLMLLSIESVVISFLSLQTPYLLLIWMSSLIHVPGGRNPGKALQPWIYAVSILSSLGLVFRAAGRKEYWIFKKIGDALTFIPVRRTLIMYNSVSTSRARYSGRGSVLSQIVMIGEYYSLFANLTDIGTKFTVIVGLVEYSTMARSTFIKGLYEDNSFAMFSRILLHSILINVLDETYELRNSSSNSTESGDTSVGEGTSATPTSGNGTAGLTSVRGSVRKGPSREIVTLV